MANVILGAGATVTFGTSGFSANVLSINGSDISRGEVESTHMGTVDWMTYVPEALADPGTLELEIQLDPDSQPPMLAPAETITIVFRKPTGYTSGASFSTSAFVTGWNWTAALKGLLTGSVTLKCTGEPTWTDAVA